jgi:hypothetical protein
VLILELPVRAYLFASMMLYVLVICSLILEKLLYAD